MYADIFGPYTRKDGRKHIVLRFDDGTRATISYPKWLMELKIGRMLDEDETVDHINRDFTDDRLENLQIKLRSIHASDDAKRVRGVQIKCAYCGKISFKEARNIRQNSKMKKAGPFCSKSCAGKYSNEIQNGRRSPLPPQKKVKSQYYQIVK